MPDAFRDGCGDMTRFNCCWPVDRDVDVDVSAVMGEDARGDEVERGDVKVGAS
jgi:hypothetical protein